MLRIFRGIIKNRPALGERALQELLDAKLLKFNYFLTDARGRNVKSYMKIPIPSTSDPAREQFMNTLLKHDVNIDEYCSIYEKSAIPLQNNLSKLTLEIFEHSACFVNQYSKYRIQLSAVIKKQIENGSILQTEEGNFFIQNQTVFTCQFDDIENLAVGARTEQITAKQQAVNTMYQETRSVIQSKHTTAAGVSVSHDTVEKTHEIQHHSFTEKSNDQRDADIAGKH
jgi:hypothetical protein